MGSARWRAKRAPRPPVPPVIRTVRSGSRARSAPAGSRPGRRARRGASASPSRRASWGSSSASERAGSACLGGLAAVAVDQGEAAGVLGLGRADQAPDAAAAGSGDSSSPVAIAPLGEDRQASVGRRSSASHSWIGSRASLRRRCERPRRRRTGSSASRAPSSTTLRRRLRRSSGSAQLAATRSRRASRSAARRWPAAGARIERAQRRESTVSRAELRRLRRRAQSEAPPPRPGRDRDPQRVGACAVQAHPAPGEGQPRRCRALLGDDEAVPCRAASSSAGWIPKRSASRACSSGSETSAKISSPPLPGGASGPGRRGRTRGRPRPGARRGPRASSGSAPCGRPGGRGLGRRGWPRRRGCRWRSGSTRLGLPRASGREWIEISRLPSSSGAPTRDLERRPPPCSGRTSGACRVSSSTVSAPTCSAPLAGPARRRRCRAAGRVPATRGRPARGGLRGRCGR